MNILKKFVINYQYTTSAYNHTKLLFISIKYQRNINAQSVKKLISRDL